MIFKGNCTALITPFKKNKKINFEVLKNLIEQQIQNNTSAILILGTTGESSTLSIEEKTKIVTFCKKQINNRAALIVGAGSNNTEEAIKLSKLFEKLGADALLSITPYYNKTTQNGLIKHFSLIAKSVKIPIILYNVPSRTGINMLPKTVFALSKISNIVGIKEASGNLNQVCEIIKLCSKDFCVYSGDDNLTFPILCLGGNGVFSVTANLFPKQVNLLCQNFFEGNLKKAQKIHFDLFNISSALFCEVNPIPIKDALNIVGIKVGSCRLPLIKISQKNHKMLEKNIKKVDF